MHCPARDTGSVLILALMLVLVLALFASSLVMTQATTQAAGAGLVQSVELTYAKANLREIAEWAQNELFDQAEDIRDMTQIGSVTVGGPGFSYDVASEGAYYQSVSADGDTSYVQRYVVHAELEADGFQLTLDRIIDVAFTPVFQFMIYFEGDCEILPGADMTLNGRVHANGDVFIGTSSTLTVDSEYLRCSGEIYRKRKNDNSTTGGTVNIRVKGTPLFANMTSSMDSQALGWATLATLTWNGSVRTASHGVKRATAPGIGSILAYDPVTGQKGYYHDNADLIIVNTTAYDRNGFPVTLPSGAVRSITMYDARERTDVTLTEIDLGILGTSAHYPANGLLYAYRTDASASSPNGIRLKNGAELAGPLTVATEDPLYVLGNFNTVNKVGAAVIADALNLLSSQWDDTRDASPVPPAESTTYNLAGIAGSLPTPDGGGTYSGGFENFPRFHENWSGKTATIRGSFVRLYESQIGTTSWGGSNVYSAPKRDWRFDSDLLTIGNIPPFTPVVVQYEVISETVNVVR